MAQRQGYRLSYDFLDRLTAANYYDINDAGTATASLRYNEVISYADMRGNIGSLTRQGGQRSGPCWDFAQIDNLSYAYTAGTNKLSSITDAAIATHKAKGFNPGAGSGNYSYDLNGNMTTDPYKAMTVAYNHLNLPRLFSWTGGGYQGNSVEILYDAAGTKLKKTVKTGATVNYTQDYIGGIEYQDGVREAIYTAEGRLFNNAGANRYEYTVKDHLGNARLSFTDKNGNGVVDFSTEVLQENHYYPFGLGCDGPWVNDAARDNRYQYNGKEWNDDFGLNLNDYGARWYDAGVGRWWSVDPRVGSYTSLSPYNYANCNAINNKDINGEYVVVTNLMNSDNKNENAQNIITLGNLLLELNKMTGMNIGIKNTGGVFLLKEIGDPKNANGGSKSARAYMRHLLGSGSGTLTISRSEDGSRASVRGSINLDNNQIEGFISGSERMGLSPLTTGYGMTFFHESLHTKGGARYFSEDPEFKDRMNGGVFTDDFSNSDPGAVVGITNRFSSELGLPNRVTYGNRFDGMSFKDGKGNKYGINENTSNFASESFRAMRAHQHIMILLRLK